MNPQPDIIAAVQEMKERTNDALTIAGLLVFAWLIFSFSRRRY